MHKIVRMMEVELGATIASAAIGLAAVLGLLGWAVFEWVLVGR